MKHAMMYRCVIVLRSSLRAALLLACVAGATVPTSAWAQGPIRVAVAGAQMVHSDKLSVSQEFPAMLQALLDKDGPGKYSVVNCGDCCSTVSLNYTADETHPYLKPGNNSQFLPGYPTLVKTMPNVVIIGPWGKHDRELSMGIKGTIQLTQAGYEKDYETMISTFEALPTHPKMFACLPIPIPFAMASGPVNDVILPATKAVLARHPEITAIDLWTPFLGKKELFQNDTGNRAGTHLTHPEGLMLIASTVYPVFKAAMDGTGTTADAAAPGGDDAGQPVGPGSGGSSGAGATGGSIGGGTAGISGSSGTGGLNGGSTGGSGASTGGQSGSGSGPADASAPTSGATRGGKAGGCSYGSTEGQTSVAMCLMLAMLAIVAGRRRTSR
jgi:hypothetical protein